MEANKYSIFLEVAKQQSLSRAAENMGYTQSGVSHTLKRLEKEMGLKLFDRNRNGAFLTNAGQELLPYISQLVQCRENLSQAVQSLHHLSRGSLTIGTYSSISRQWLPHIIRQFRMDHPSIRIDFKEGGNEDILRWIRQREVDLGFLSGHIDGDMEWIPLKKDPLLAVLPSDYPHKEQVFALDKFNGQTFIISALGTDVDVHGTLEQYHVAPDVQYSSKDDYTIVSMVAGHLGISILPKLVLESYEAPIRTLPLAPYADRELGIALVDRSMASPATLKFIEYAKDYVLALAD